MTIIETTYSYVSEVDAINKKHKYVGLDEYKTSLCRYGMSYVYDEDGEYNEEHICEFTLDITYYRYSKAGIDWTISMFKDTLHSAHN